jgi:hypothetical protein
MLQKSLVPPPRRAETRHFPYSVLAAFIGLNVPLSTPHLSLAPAFLAERRVSARRGGRVRCLAYLSILRMVLLFPQTGRPVTTPACTESVSAAS